MDDRTSTYLPAGEAQALFGQANALFQAGDPERAAELYRQALQLAPTFPEASFNLGCSLDRLGQPGQAVPHFAQAAALRPDWWQARCNLALALARTGRMAEAVLKFQEAVQLAPQEAGIRNNLGLALSAMGRGEEAHLSFREALRLKPEDPEIHGNLAALFERYGRSSEAIACCLEAIRLRPDYPEAHLHLGNALKSQGRHHEALAHYREALRLRPDYPEAHSSLLFTLCYPAGIPRAEVFAQYRSFGALNRRPALPHDNDPDPGRPLRIGYVSADFRAHAVARFIEPVLAHHDRERVSIHCYANVSVPDRTSTRLAELAGHMVNIAGMPDAEAAALIRRDRIDILIDLSGHTAGNRLTLFALKPAPVQMTWLGYPQTTGLEAIDYRITDAVTDPPGTSEAFHSEELLRLPGCFTCFAPPADTPEVAELPVLSRGSLTFGSFNNPAKITPETVELWAAVLAAVPGSRMLVKGYSLADHGTRDRLCGLFAAQGIGPERLELVGNTVSYREHLELYAQVDIALDCFPYNGTTTTCEALWMGVPVLTCPGESHLSRVGASLLTSVGLGSLIAGGPGEFVRLAADLARDPERLGRLRGGLRGLMAGSPLTDAARFTGELEEAFRSAWHGWCARTQGGQSHEPADPAQAAESQLKYARILMGKGMPDEARAQLEELLRRHPGCAEAHYTLAVICASQECAEPAERHFLKALGAEPENVKALNGLGIVLQKLGRPEEAAGRYQEAVRINPRYQEAQLNLALLLKDHGRLCAAQRQLEWALGFEPDAVRLRYNLANILQRQGKSPEACAHYREVLRLDPEHLGARQNLLFALHYSEKVSDRQIFEEHLAAAARGCFSAPPVPRPAVVAPAGRRIRIGYLSPDFRSHAVACFIEPILLHHDRERFEITCYANLSRTDETTGRLMGLAEHWRDICQMGDEAAARLIAEDGIDILVDLAGHTSGNRLALLARRPAPLQATWIGYPDTTGLSALDYRITDAIADPPGATEQLHSERLIRLGRSFCCYLPPQCAPPVAPAPVAATGRITFGSFNNLAKVTPEVVALWARVLLAVPGSRLLLKCAPLADPELGDGLRERFRAEGVAAERLELHPGEASPADHLAHYARVDIALDTFPYNGTTTTCEALWMGVPVVTLAGTRHAGRTGASLLNSCGLWELVAQSADEYLDLACRLAGDAGKLQLLRSGLRDRMARSPLTDGAGVTRELERAFEGMLEESWGEQHYREAGSAG